MRKTMLGVILLTLLWITPSANAESTKDTLSLSGTIEAALKQNNDLLYYNYMWEMLDNQQKKSKDELSKIPAPSEPKVNLLPVSFDDFLAVYPDFEELPEEDQDKVIRIIETQIQINDSIINEFLLADYQNQVIEYAEMQKQVTEQKKQLDLLVKELDYEKLLSTIEKAEKEQAIKKYVTNLFMNIIRTEEQVRFHEKELEMIKMESHKLKKMHELGLISQFEAEGTELEVIEKLHEIEQVQKTLKTLKLQLALYSGIQFKESSKYVSPELPELPKGYKASELKNLNQVIDGLFIIKKAQQNVTMAAQRMTIANSAYEKLQFENQMKMFEAKVKELKKDAEITILDKYKEFSQTAQEILVLKKKVEKQQRIEKYAAKQLKLGMISSYEYEKVKLDLDRVYWEYKEKQMTAFLSSKEEEFIKAGLLQ